MRRLLYAVFLGLVGAGIVHIVILFAIPHVVRDDIWTSLSQRADLYQPVRIDPAAGAPLLHLPDPLFEAVACRFDLSRGMVQLAAGRDVPYWSMSIYDRRGMNIFSINDRTSSDGMLDFLVASPAQMAELRRDLPQDMADAVFVETDVGEGIAVVRAFVPDATWEPTISRYLEAIRCAPLAMDF